MSDLPAGASREIIASHRPRSAALLRVRELTTSLVIGGALRPIVSDLSFTIGRGEVVGLVGESGSGKSVTARSLIGLLPAGARSNGLVELDGYEPLKMPRRELRQFRRDKVGMIFQDPRAHIDPLWRVGDYVGEGLRDFRGATRQQARERSLSLLRGMGIVDPERVLHSYPGQLSGGMLQRVMIAGALSCDPPLVIADEATTALDVTVQSDVLAILRGLQQSRELSLLFITHDLGLASVICDRVVVMYAGRAMAVQPAAELFRAPVHPYAAALISAMPRLESKSPRLKAVPGRPLSALDVPAGCPFRSRCPFAVDKCEQVTPVLKELQPGNESACIRAGEIGDELERIVRE
jgi:oligopeptide/dipeptide ABC transporter ATP-binding protein